jgi:uncharacterized protein YcfJ
MSTKIRYFAVALGATLALPTASWAADLRYAWADVVESQPVHQQVRIPERREVCWDESVYQATPVRRSATPKIFGAILGGVIGNQFGGGSGRDLMTVAGAALGASVAADEQRRRYPDRYYETIEQRCETRTEFTYEDRIVGWDVTYEFNGELYRARLREAPADRIRVQVGVQPAEG